MNIFVIIAFGAAILAFGPGFVFQAALGYLFGTWAGSYCRTRLHMLHCEICRHTGDPVSDMNALGDYAYKASQIGGVICIAVPMISFIVGAVCEHRANKLKMQAATAGCGNGTINVGSVENSFIRGVRL